ncbi:MAG: peptidylprolyl isomerase, partial [Halomonas sp.]
MKIRALLCVATLLAALPTAAVGEETLDRIVAVANQEVVLASELAQEVERVRAQFYQQGQQPPPAEQLREQVLERLVAQRLQLGRAERVGLQVDDATLDAAVQRIAAQNNMTLSQLRDALAQQGMDFTSFREDLRQQITLDRLHQAKIQEEVQVSEQEIDEAVEAAAAQDNQEYRVAHIRVGTPEGASPEELAEAEEQAEALRERVVQEEQDFSALAETFSDAATASEGGRLGWRLAGQLPSAFEDVVKRLEPGEISEVVQASDGFHIVKLLDQRSEGAEIVEETRVRQILLETGDGVEDEDARKRLESFRERIREGESFAFLARRHSDDAGAEANGGDLGWTTPGELVPDFQERLDALEVGAVSEPFRTDYGWHIVRVEDRRERNMTEERRRERIAQQIRERKSQETLEQWIRELREEAYVDIRLEE